MDHFLRDMRSRGVAKSLAAPPFTRILWAMGMKARPPLMSDWGTLFLGLGAYFGIFMGLMILFLERDAFPRSTTLLLAIGSGAAFGAVMASYYRSKAAPLDLPAWEDYASE